MSCAIKKRNYIQTPHSACVSTSPLNGTGRLNMTESCHSELVKNASEAVLEGNSTTRHILQIIGRIYKTKSPVQKI